MISQLHPSQDAFCAIKILRSSLTKLILQLVKPQALLKRQVSLSCSHTYLNLDNWHWSRCVINWEKQILVWGVVSGYSWGNKFRWFKQLHVDWCSSKECEPNSWARWQGLGFLLQPVAPQWVTIKSPSLASQSLSMLERLGCHMWELVLASSVLMFIVGCSLVVQIKLKWRNTNFWAVSKQQILCAVRGIDFSGVNGCNKYLSFTKCKEYFSTSPFLM